ncbi:hypothetical protein J1N35_027648 [Gossypium stocksii]|uniref:Reverse transcriptase domain-containing protein n=1 Tax=Gossypium stocksii TaxID=47602 RepID=A0A9D3VAN2_9ROSI|nr:hypothetical protein J1N35_027648 [Gossypium stocksii]
MSTSMSSLHSKFTDQIMDDDQLKLKAVNFYSNLYGEHLGPRRDVPSIAFSCLNDEDFNFLNRLVLDEKIKGVLFYMAPLKALGSDSFHTLFYQSQWDHVGTSVYVWIKEVFNGKNIDSDLNNSLIVLIPKTYNLVEFSQFQPISLCSVLYKLVLKIIANRFRVIFLRLLAPEQVRFVVGRSITDNIIIAQEVIHSMKGMHKNRKWIAIKIDQEKAFDRVRWDFIEASLQAAGLSIRKAINDSNWSPIMLSCGGPPLSHIFFADNLTLRSDRWKPGSSHQKCFILIRVPSSLPNNLLRSVPFYGDLSLSLCGYDYEDVVHVLRDCNVARRIWDKFIPQQNLSAFYSGSLSDWLRSNLQRHFTYLDGIDWPCRFRIIMWRI